MEALMKLHENEGLLTNGWVAMKNKKKMKLKEKCW